MLKVLPEAFGTMSYFKILQPSDKCLFSSVSSNSELYFPLLTFDVKAELVMLTTNTFLIFIDYLRFILNFYVLSFSGKLRANVCRLW